MGSNRRTLGIVGASALLLGFFLPVVSVFGLLNLSYFDLLTKISARFSTGLVIAALGGLSLALALKNNFRPLIGTGALALAILVFDYVSYKSAARGMGPGATGMGAPADEFTTEIMGVLIQPAWGLFVLVAGAILLIVAGALKDRPAPGADWRNSPPPPMNYS